MERPRQGSVNSLGADATALKGSQPPNHPQLEKGVRAGGTAEGVRLPTGDIRGQSGKRSAEEGREKTGKADAATASLRVGHSPLGPLAHPCAGSRLRNVLPLSSWSAFLPSRRQAGKPFHVLGTTAWQRKRTRKGTHHTLEVTKLTKVKYTCICQRPPSARPW